MPVNEWTVFFHHGSGYVDSFNTKVARYIELVNDLVAGWPAIYFGFSYAPRVGEVNAGWTPWIGGDVEALAAL